MELEFIIDPYTKVMIVIIYHFKPNILYSQTEGVVQSDYVEQFAYTVILSIFLKRYKTSRMKMN